MKAKHEEWSWLVLQFILTVNVPLFVRLFIAWKRWVLLFFISLFLFHRFCVNKCATCKVSPEFFSQFAEQQHAFDLEIIHAKASLVPFFVATWMRPSGPQQAFVEQHNDWTLADRLLMEIRLRTFHVHFFLSYPLLWWPKTRTAVSSGNSTATELHPLTNGFIPYFDSPVFRFVIREHSLIWRFPLQQRRGKSDESDRAYRLPTWGQSP